MKYNIYCILFIACLLVGCGEPKTVIEPMPTNISATILLPSKKPLSNQKIILMPTELYGIARSIVLDTDSKGTALIAEAFPTQYKVYVILKSPKHKQYLPSKYYDREDDESDLLIDMNTVNGNITLKMNDK